MATARRHRRQPGEPFRASGRRATGPHWQLALEGKARVQHLDPGGVAGALGIVTGGSPA
jgi:hypothetical protein